MAKLTYVRGIDENISLRLREIGIRSTSGLLREGATEKGRLHISRWCGIEEETVHRFVIQADMMRITGIGKDYAAMLEAIGISSVVDLAREDPRDLSDALLEVNLLRGLVRAVPSERRVSGWVRQAEILRSRKFDSPG